jgi:hypothetical protein
MSRREAVNGLIYHFTSAYKPDGAILLLLSLLEPDHQVHHVRCFQAISHTQCHCPLRHIIQKAMYVQRALLFPLSRHRSVPAAALRLVSTRSRRYLLLIVCPYLFLISSSGAILLRRTARVRPYLHTLHFLAAKPRQRVRTLSPHPFLHPISLFKGFWDKRLHLQAHNLINLLITRHDYTVTKSERFSASGPYFAFLNLFSLDMNLLSSYCTHIFPRVTYMYHIYNTDVSYKCPRK